MSRALLGTAGVAALLLLTGCEDIAGFEGINEDFHSSYNVKAGGHLELTNRNGGVEITGWDRDSVEVAGTKYAPDRDSLRDVKVDVQQDGDRLVVRTETPKGNWRGGNFGVRYRIHVPRQFMLDRVETTNGAITAEDLQGGGKLKSTNGKLAFARLTGNYNAETTNGGIELTDLSGEQHLATTNGGVRGSLKQGSVEASSTNGAIDITVAQPQADRPIRVETTNGSVQLAMAEFRGNPVHAETTHGSVTLRLPEGTNATLDAHTSSAKVTSDLPLTSTEDSSKHSLRGRLGSGGPTIEASSSSGSIRVERF